MKWYFEPMRTIIGALLSGGSLLTAQDIKTQTLANGMKVIVQEDHAIPNVAMYFFYKVGSRNEHPGATGVSHFFEHMMFNGAKKYGPKEFDKQHGKERRAATTPTRRTTSPSTPTGSPVRRWT